MNYRHNNDRLLFQKPLLEKNAAENLWADMRKKAGERLKFSILRTDRGHGMDLSTSPIGSSSGGSSGFVVERAV
jgi:hypothetical protein